MVFKYPRSVVRWLCILLIVIFALTSLQGAGPNLSLFLLYCQDRWLLLVGGLLLALSLWRLPLHHQQLKGDWRLALCAGSAMAALAFAGHYWILCGYDMSRDEQMATFDAAVFAKGLLAAPLPPMWRDHADALNTMFMYPADHRGAWISAYLPLNALLRTIAGTVATPALVGPLMTLIGALALWGCARRIWPDNREAAVVSTILYVGSAQILFNGMTAYAMPAHLALNLCWLWLFLGRRWWMDGLAIIVAFVAVGLHQPHMHPLFAGPILFLLILERNWGRAAFYLAGYAAIGAFWLWWPNAMWAMSQTSELAQKPEGVDYLTRLLTELQKSDRMVFVNMAANLLRFAAWQHVLLIPLMAMGFGVARQNRLAGALVAGIVLTLIVMAIILPYQGHGFGYRYLHAVTGNALLLAAFGWIDLAQRREVWRPLLMRTTVAGLCILLPLQAWMAHQFYAPFAQVTARINASPVDYVVVGQGDAPFSADLVINVPFLEQRPTRLLREAVDMRLISAMCVTGATVSLVGVDTLAPIAAYYNVTAQSSLAADNAQLATQLSKAGCQVVAME